MPPSQSLAPALCSEYGISADELAGRPRLALIQW